MNAQVKRSAEISECGRYRWALYRSWSGGTKGIVCFIMLNPSKADGSIDDPTIRRCIAFAMAWGYSGMVIVNLFALRSTDPKELWKENNPMGGARNDSEILGAVEGSNLTVAAWGTKMPYRRDWEVEKLLKGQPIHCLKKSKNGSPVHPLYQPANLTPQPVTPTT